jgi:hypothetical protein
MTADAGAQRNAPCPCGSGKRYKHCCGDLARSAVEPTASPLASDPAAIREAKTRRTYVVMGSPRGGTSLLAGVLHRAGVYMGAFRTKQYEDPEFKIPPERAFDAVAQLAPVIRSRNAQYEYWGWKLPNNIYYIRKVRPLLIRPLFLFIYRNPQETARSSARHDRRDWTKEGEQLLRGAIVHASMVREFQRSLTDHFHAFDLEAIHADPVAFVDRISGVLESLPVQREELLQFVHREGGYH